MSTKSPYLAIFSAFAICLLTSSCAIKDLKDDLDIVAAEYGYLKGRVAGDVDGSTVLLAVFRQEQDGLSIAHARSVNSGEPFYVLLPDAGYTVTAFADINGDFNYQPGEPAARVDGPVINWFRDIDRKERVDADMLLIQEFRLADTLILDQKIDLTLEGVREENKIGKNFLRLVSWDDDAFSEENKQLGMWRPSAFQKQVGFGLYVLEEFDPAKKTVVLVHGINDTPRVFENFVSTIPSDHQVLLFHYPSAFPLEYTSHILTGALEVLIRRYAIPQLDVVAHSMGGLVSKGMIYQANDELRQRMPVFISVATPFGGHSAAASGLKWSPVIAPVWWAMAPGSAYLENIDSVDLTQGPAHHLVYSYSHELGGKRKKDDGVVTVESQLVESAQRSATAVYGVADNHVGVLTNPCTLALVHAILSDGSSEVAVSEC